MTGEKKYKIAATTVAILGSGIAFAMVRLQYLLVYIGLVISFVLIGLFIWYVGKRYKNSFIPTKVLWLGGALSGFLIGFRPTMTAGPEPWRWLPAGEGYFAVVIRAHMDWIPAALTWTVFFAIGVILWILGRKGAAKSN